MKTSHIIIILGVIISISIIFGVTFKIPLDDSAQTSFESPFRDEYYEIQITGMKDIYRIGEQYDFSYIISGYGYSCGSKKITFPDQNGETMTTYSSSSCIAEEPMREFVIDSKKEYDTTSVNGNVKIPGIYNVTVTFDRPSRDFPTTAIKEFRVPPLNSWYNNQLRDTDLQTVMNSCANDSPKERMKNALRYTNETHVFMNLGCEWKKIGKFVGELENENAESGSYELDEALCMGGRGYIVNDECERIGKYDPETGIPIVENKEQCDMLDGDWNQQQKTCDSKYGVE